MIDLKTIKKYMLVLPTNTVRMDNANYIKQTYFPDLDFRYVINSVFDTFAYENIINNTPKIQTTIWEDKLPHYRSIQEYSCAYEHYRIIKEAYLLKYPYVFIMEDDISIDYDLSIIDEFLSNVPDEFDLLKLGYWNHDVKTFEYDTHAVELYEKNHIYWIPSNDMLRYCNLANIYSYNGMYKYLQFQDKHVTFSDLWTYIINDDKKYISTVSLINALDIPSSIGYN